MSSSEEIHHRWIDMQLSEKMADAFGTSVTLTDEVECIKKSAKSSIWRLQAWNGRESMPMILKIFNPERSYNQVELQIYLKAVRVFPDFIPKVYVLENQVMENETWLFLEHVPSISETTEIQPELLLQIIPSIAKFHSLTFDQRFDSVKVDFCSWLPIDGASKMIEARRTSHLRLKAYWTESMKEPNLKKLIEPHYSNIEKVLEKGPVYFPELIQGGQSIIHNDLHLMNIGFRQPINQTDRNPAITFIDWEGAQFASVWFDLAKLIGLLIDFRAEWYENEEAIYRRCVKLYVKEMEKYGIKFHKEPIKLYQMAYIQRTLENWLPYELYAILNGKPRNPFLVTRYLEKILVWGKELGLS